MADSLTSAPRADVAAVVLAAGEGRRLRPLTQVRPKPLCPVGNRLLVDHAIDAVRAAVGPGAGAVAVNVHHGREQLEAHLATRDVHVSIEARRALGTAGAIGHLRGWLSGRAALIVNADAWAEADLAAFVAGWDGERVRILVPGTEPFGPRSGIVASILPGPVAATLSSEPSGLWEVCWRDALAAGRLDTAAHLGPFTDCGTPAQYLAANLGAVAAAGGSLIDPGATIADDAVVVRSVVGPGASVEGTVRDTVLWPGATVGPRELLDRAIRTGADRVTRVTVLVR